MGILKWVDYTLSEPSFFKLMTDSTPLHLALLDEVMVTIHENYVIRFFILMMIHFNILDKHLSSITTFASVVITDQNI